MDRKRAYGALTQVVNAVMTNVKTDQFHQVRILPAQALAYPSSLVIKPRDGRLKASWNKGHFFICCCYMCVSNTSIGKQML